MPQHLRDAAERRHREAIERATKALAELASQGEPITFSNVARSASVSTDFLYRQPELRKRIQELRTTDRNRRKAPVDEPRDTSSAPIRALSAQIKDLRRRQNQDVARLKDALAVAHGENLRLRRRLAKFE